MKIKAKIDRMVNSGNVKAIASVSLDGMFVVKNLKIMDGRKGLFVSMPQETFSGAFTSLAPQETANFTTASTPVGLDTLCASVTPEKPGAVFSTSASRAKASRPNSASTVPRIWMKVTLSCEAEDFFHPSRW